MIQDAVAVEENGVQRAGQKAVCGVGHPAMIAIGLPAPACVGLLALAGGAVR